MSCRESRQLRLHGLGGRSCRSCIGWRSVACCCAELRLASSAAAAHCSICPIIILCRYTLYRDDELLGVLTE